MEVSHKYITFAIDKRDCMENNDNPSALTLGQRRNSVAELSEDDRQTVHEEWQI